jgi:predicted helicase
VHLRGKEGPPDAKGVHFGFALSDRHLRIKKRLFLAATPRHCDLRWRDPESDARLVDSMDAPEIYGTVAHDLTFAEADRRGIICHCRVIISVTTTGMVDDTSRVTANPSYKAMPSRPATSRRRICGSRIGRRGSSVPP